MGFTEKTPEYQACMNFLEATSPKYKKKEKSTGEVIDLISSGDSPNKMDILFIERRKAESKRTISQSTKPRKKNMKNWRTTTIRRKQETQRNRKKIGERN